MKEKYDVKKLTYVLLFSIFISLIAGCNYIERKKGYEISEPIRTDIWKLESDFCTSVMKREYDKSLRLLNDSFSYKLKGLKLDSVFYSLRYGLFEFPFYTQNIYYQKSQFGKSIVDVLFDDEEIKNFSLKFTSNCKEMALTTAILGSGDIRSCITMIFGKYSDQWKIDYVSIGLFMAEGKDAIDCIKDAENWIEQKDYVMAEYNMKMCDWLLKPDPVLWHYENEHDLLVKIEKLDRKIRHNLCFMNPIEEIGTQPQILDFYPVLINKKIYPAISYYTKLPLKDSTAIEKECSELDVVFAKCYKNVKYDSILVRIINHEDTWLESKKCLIKKKKLNKISI